MGRKRKNNGDKTLPPYTYRGKTAFEYRPYKGVGFKRPGVKLCPLNAQISEVWRKWEEKQGQVSFTLSWLLNEYQKSPQFKMRGNKEKSRDTVTGQERQINFIIKYPLKNGKTFGPVELKKITRGTMRKFLDSRLADDAAVSGNREKSLISTAWNWALERDNISWPNPCEKVSRNPESPRTRYVTDYEYEIAYKIEGPVYIQVAMELAYLCRMRRGEILKATKNQITPEGFDTKRSKGSKDAITEWSDRLSAAISVTKSFKSCIESIYILHNKYGQPISRTAFKSAWTRRKKKMKELNIEPFNFHDLKAKGVSDFKGNKQDASGHKTLAQVAVYDRKKIIVKATR